METRSHVHEIELFASPAEVFRLLVTPSAIREWWSAARAIVIARTGGVWCAAWGDREDDPDYITAAIIKVYDPPQRLVLSDFDYYAKSGPLPFDASLTTEFRISARGPNRSSESTRRDSRRISSRTSSTRDARLAGVRRSTPSECTSTLTTSSNRNGGRGVTGKS